MPTIRQTILPIPSTSRRLVAAVVGTSGKKLKHLGRVPTLREAAEVNCNWHTETERKAKLIGRVLAESGYIVLTGGMGGIMDTVIRSAREHGALTMTILPGEHHDLGIAPAEIVLPSGIGFARNYLTALACDLMVGLPGGQGTLQEMSFAHDFGRKVFSWESWGKSVGVKDYTLEEEVDLLNAIATFMPSATSGGAATENL